MKRILLFLIAVTTAAALTAHADYQTAATINGKPLFMRHDSLTDKKAQTYINNVINEELVLQ